MQREKWGTKLGFIMAAAGSAIGLGTLWKFPYMAGQNGGGLFVLFYLLCTLFVGFPVFVAELLIGRHTQRGAVGTFITLQKKQHFWKIAGWLGVISSFLIMSYYSVVAGWGLHYAWMSLNEFYAGKSATQIEEIFTLLTHSSDMVLISHFAFTAIVVALVMPGIRSGIEYWSKLMTTWLLVILVTFVIYSMTLSGYKEALSFVLLPDFANFKPKAIIEALGLSFFTLSLGQGIMITYGSYLRKEDDIPKTALLICCIVPVIALLIAIMLFSIIFTFQASPEGGPGLIFKTLPLIFAKLPGALILSTAFFVLFVFTALTSAIAFIEVVAANLIDLYGWPRKKAVLAVGCACFILGIPSALGNTDYIFGNWSHIYGKSFFETVDDLASIWLMPLGGCILATFVGWNLDRQIIEEEFKLNSSMSRFFGIWLLLLRWIAPVAILLILLHHTGIMSIDAWLPPPPAETVTHN
jgi:NSS family neurotransmitter:Na+ symporter